MKIKFLSIACLALTSFIFCSCSKDDNNGQSTPTKFSTSTVEENKATIEENGFNFLGDIQSIESSASVQASINAAYYFNNGYIFENNSNFPQVSKNIALANELLKPITIASNLKEFSTEKLVNDLTRAVSYTLADYWNKVVGTYTWNYETEEWDYKTSTNNEIYITFPSDESGTTNNASIRIYNFKTTEGEFSWAETTVLPTKLNFDLKVNNKDLLTFSFNAAYNTTDKTPSSMSFILDLASTYTISLEGSNNSETGSIAFNWKKSGTTIMAFSLKVNGDWTSENLAQENLEIGDVFHSGNTSLQIMNIKVVGNVDYASMETSLKALKASNSISDDSLYIAAQCDIINKDANLALCFADNNLIIAKVIAYPYSEKEWNSDTQQYDKEYEIGAYFKFSDNSTIDPSTYFKEGFDNLEYQFYYYYKELMEKYAK